MGGEDILGVAHVRGGDDSSINRWRDQELSQLNVTNGKLILIS